MKKLAIILTFVISVFSLGNTVVAQESVPKSVLLNTLNNVNDLDLSNYKTEELYQYNERYTDDVYDIIDSDKTEKDKIDALKVLKNDTEKDLEDLLGKDYKHYKNLMEKELKPLKRKSKLFKYII
ncbi:MAG: hypothetical protein OEM04_00780 [Flavobacteriaceae bacterium]|nr:hypothetical protein [Flavobacteriaceae bacterium]